MFAVPKFSSIFTLLAAMLLSSTALAEPAAERTEPDAPILNPDMPAPEEASIEVESLWELEVGGYGELHFSWLDYGPDPTRQGGSRADSRLVFDQTRFVVELEGEFPYDIEFEAEVEFEHGGTGAAREIEYEEFGEFETEIGKGGEVLVEELYLAKSFADGAIRVRAGRFYVAVGLLPEFHEPTDYLASARPESAETVLPGVWDEMGADVRARLGIFELTAQVVNGLDSTGFSSQFWVSSGHQASFELVRATDLAGVLRVDATPIDGLLLGASAYYGGTSRNRPSADLAQQCADGSTSDEREVAPCGYVDAALLIVDAHAAVDLAPVRARAAVVWGHLENADVISEKNRTLSNHLGVLRSEVAEQAVAAWAEVGVDVADFTTLSAHHRIEPFVRAEYYDTMFNRPEGSFDNPRFETYLLSAGVGYALRESITAKLDWTHRRHGTDALATENSARLGLGFVF
jgi:hypothetical protein